MNISASIDASFLPFFLCISSFAFFFFLNLSFCNGFLLKFSPRACFHWKQELVWLTGAVRFESSLENEQKEKKTKGLNPFSETEREIRQRSDRASQTWQPSSVHFPSGLLPNVCHNNDGVAAQGGLRWCLSPKTNTAERWAGEDNVSSQSLYLP